MQDHLDEMERMRVVLLDAYPLLALDGEEGVGSDGGGGPGLPLRQGGSRRAGGKPCPGGEGHTTSSSSSSTGRAHHLTLDLRGFSPEEVKVSLEGRKLTVEGKYERRTESAEDGCLSYDARHLRRQLLLPEDADLDAVSTALALDGHLCIEVPRLAPKERVIPITITKGPSGAAAGAGAGGEDGAAKKKKKAEDGKVEDGGGGK
ncbi:hypothetical protein JRQ81_010914 [Phrynocephalus forsythii]|uniref:SHSP domain-containing protein n=1 Tax=Phrynocephalus forsythii TaxID=171643 RepID=A0A9Q0Y0H2_9SAUR|nr:hypothetical protein JRQ81_010914 [Phrynocephalus forsythii]